MVQIPLVFIFFFMFYRNFFHVSVYLSKIEFYDDRNGAMIFIERIPLSKENERPYIVGIRDLIGGNLLYIYALVPLSPFMISIWTWCSLYFGLSVICIWLVLVGFPPTFTTHLMVLLLNFYRLW